MKRYLIWYSLALSLLIAGNSCKQEYNPPASANANTNYLVVDGYINSGSDTTLIKLSRTRSLIAAPFPVPEKTAQVVLEGNGGFSMQLANLGDGTYRAVNLNLDGNQQYRLDIITSNGSKYVSDYVPVVLSPAIDTISFQRSDTSGVTIFANTHGVPGGTSFYRWDYTETWENHSSYPSYLRYDPAHDSIYMTNEQTPSVCWQTNNAINISLATSSALGQNVIYHAPLTVISPNTSKLAFRYSILVRQYGLTANAYNYWQNVKKTSELSGTLFDQEPSQITGNLHCITNTTEPVLGYVGVGTVTTQRIFITNSQVQPWNYTPACGYRPTIRDSVGYLFTNDYFLLAEPVDAGPGQAVTKYYMSSDFCVDCSVRFGKSSGTAVPPPFW